MIETNVVNLDLSLVMMYVNDIRMMFVELNERMRYLDDAEEEIYQTKDRELTEIAKRNPKVIAYFIQGTSIIFDGERKRTIREFNDKIIAKMKEIAEKFKATVIYYREAERIGFDSGIHIKITGVTVIIPLVENPDKAFFIEDKDEPLFLEYHIKEDGSFWVEKPLYDSSYRGTCVRYWT